MFFIVISLVYMLVNEIYVKHLGKWVFEYRTKLKHFVEKCKLFHNFLRPTRVLVIIYEKCTY